ncbi:hypothetical protein ACFL6H_01755 [Candidatus Latescibacterota bacterium]
MFINSIYTILLFFCLAGLPIKAFAEYSAGLAINPSSNMFLRPKGKSGTTTSLFGSAGYSLGKTTVSYGLNLGMVQHYPGLQINRHNLSVSYLHAANDNFACNTVIEGNLSRFGNVTTLEGYNNFRISSNIKAYLSDSVLLSWKGIVGRRSYNTFKRENYNEATALLRLDKFLASGTTLRGQFDAGFRKYYEQSSAPSITLFGFIARVAQSLRPGWGTMIEAHTRKTKDSSSRESSIVYNRVFLDDKYKYSSVGITAGTTLLIKRTNSVQFSVAYSERTYDDSQTYYFSYLPPEGWKEFERGIYLTFKSRYAFIAKFLQPSCILYHIDIKSTEERYSCKSTGLAFRMELR